MTLNKGPSDEIHLWETDSYMLLVSDEGMGYNIVNKQTLAIEMFMDQEPQALMALMWMQEQYDEVMTDPQREYTVRANKRQVAERMGTKAPYIN